VINPRVFDGSAGARSDRSVICHQSCTNNQSIAGQLFILLSNGYWQIHYDCVRSTRCLDQYNTALRNMYRNCCGFYFRDEMSLAQHVGYLENGVIVYWTFLTVRPVPYNEPTLKSFPCLLALRFQDREQNTFHFFWAVGGPKQPQWCRVFICASHHNTVVPMQSRAVCLHVRKARDTFVMLCTKVGTGRKE
jgi:hypothetical protein